MTTREERLTELAALAEPSRRSLYLHVVASPDPVSREAAADALGVSRPVAAFHLDKLAETGLLAVEYRRPPGRSGPGAGRPAKLYRPAEREVAFSVPERHYDVAAGILAQATDDATRHGIPIEQAVRETARAHGRVMGDAGRAAPTDRGDAPGTEREAARRVFEILTAQGYEPRGEGDVIRVANCPFHALAQQHRELVCGMNLELVTGVLEGAGADTLEASLDPAPGRCCVTIRASSS